MRFVVHSENDLRWYWELRVVDGKAIARSSESFESKEKAFQSIRHVRVAAAVANIYDMVGSHYPHGDVGTSGAS